MKTYLKISSFLLAICLIFNAPLTILANNTTKNSIGSINIEEDGINVGIDITQDKTTIYSESIENDGLHDTLVYVSQASSFGVFIPKTIVLSGQDKNANYLVNVNGNIGGEDTINVIPEETFVLSQFGKNDIVANVTQDKVSWKYNEFETQGNGKIFANDMTAGSWKGKFDFEISLNARSLIKTTIIDENGNNLNGRAYEIEEENKEYLLNKLEETDYVENKEDIAALIEVKTDDFENVSQATFNVSSIANEGEKVVILHYDEEKQEWEYICTDIVDENGEIQGDFTSYSPVAFIVVKEDGQIDTFSHTHNYKEIILEKGTCVVESKVLQKCACLASYEENKITENHSSQEFYHKHDNSCYITKYRGGCNSCGNGISGVTKWPTQCGACGKSWTMVQSGSWQELICTIIKHKDSCYITKYRGGCNSCGNGISGVTKWPTQCGACGKSWAMVQSGSWQELICEDGKEEHPYTICTVCETVL